MAQEIIKFYEQVDKQLAEAPSWLPCRKVGCCDGVAGCCRNSMYAMVTWLEMEHLYLTEIKKKSSQERVEIYLRAYEQVESLKQTDPEFFENLDGGKVIDVASGLSSAFKKIENKICPFLNQETNACGVYNGRPLICRSFGQCASEKTNDSGEKEPYLIGCDTTFEASKDYEEAAYPNYAGMQNVLFRLAAPSVNGFRVQMIAKPLQFWILDLADSNGDLTNPDDVFTNVRQLIASRLQAMELQQIATPKGSGGKQKNSVGLSNNSETNAKE